jgi:hypothetical protein
LPGLRKYLKQQLGLDVYRVEYFKKVNMGVAGIEGGEDSEEGGQQEVGDGASRGAQFNDASLNLVTAYGLALQGLGLNAVGGNLMPTSVVRKSMWKDKTKYFGMAAGIAAAAAGVMFVGPVRNYFAIKGTTKPAIIQQAVQRFNQLKGEAEAAGVLSAEGSDLRAANMLVLQDDRGVYSMLVNDVQKIMAAGDEAKGGWAAKIQAPGQEAPKMPDGPAFTLDTLTTRYVPPAAAQASGTEVGREEAPGPIAEFPTIRVQMQVSTAVPEAQRFADATVQKWLREAASKARPGVPYEIFFDETWMTRFAAVSQDDTADKPLTINEPGAAPARGGRDPERGAGRRPGQGGPGSLVGTRPGGSPNKQQGAPNVVGGGGEGGAANATDINGLAPLNPPEGVRDTGRAVYVWYMVFKPPAAPDAAAGGDASGKGGGT